MPLHRTGAIDARAVGKKYYPQGGDFFPKQAKRTLAALASARLYLCSMFELFIVLKLERDDELEDVNQLYSRCNRKHKTHKCND